ncbi:MAG: nicotinate-nucleotide pyrophosphorylase [Acidithiobacillales bacterium SM1_46]|nr:MAG: nicotinate-nucleotide pyrophosphorylase [Acidithiobacillales bacterium SM1_46]
MSTQRIPIPPRDDIAASVRQALAEDVGAGDLTAALLPVGALAQAQVITREDAVLSGSAWFEETFRQLDSKVVVDWKAHDAERVQAGKILCTLGGSVRSLLTGERTALNFLQLLSSTATATRRFVDAIAGTRAVILDTRKTVPGLRRAQKYAVACGGGQNHRMGLFDGILIKENHIAAAGSVTAAMQAALALAPPGIMVEIEVEDLPQLDEALAAGATRILLDNFPLDQLREAVRRTAKRATLEASGNISLESVRDIAATGVHYISIGGLTKHVRAVDLSLRFV